MADAPKSAPPAKSTDKDTLPNPIDINATGLIGKPLDRVDGKAKVTGAATYAYEYDIDGFAYGFIVNATVGKGRVIFIDTDVAEKVPGVVLVLTHRNAPAQAGYGPPKFPGDDPLGRPRPFLDGAQVRYFGEPVALVVADSFEAARHAAHLVKVRYDTEAPQTRVAPNKARAYAPESDVAGNKADAADGDFDTAFAQAPVKLDATYTTPYQIHSAMELHATIAQWDGDKVTLYSSHQIPNSEQEAVASTFQIPKDHVRIVSRYIGGGFGGKLPTEADAILAVMAARKLGRPVKVMQTRQQTFFNVYHRTETVQQVRLGATRDGKLTAIGHDAWLQTATFDEFVEPCTGATQHLYAAPHRKTSQRVVPLDLPRSGSMRAPGEAVGLLALEQAMDELAVKLDLDPVELRLRNEPEQDPAKKVPFSTRNLTGCLKEGAARFGWARRQARPAAVRDGRWLVGMGMASAIRNNIMRPSQAEVTVDNTGHVTARLAMTDIGTGSYTILTQIAAETLQVPIEQVTVLIGDTDFPETPGSGGSFGANSSGSGLFDACMAMRKALAGAAVSNGPLQGRKPDQAHFHDGRVIIGDGADSYAAIAARTATGSITAEGKAAPGDGYKSYHQASYGAHFAEVGVDPDSGEIRLRRMLGVFAAGRILNLKTATSQAMGGMLWGLSSALHEEAMVDEARGLFINHDLAEYHVPVHADIGAVEVLYLPEVDDKSGPLKIKGVGELGICGAGAAIANAVYNATGVRIRDYPLTLDKVLTGLKAA